MLRTWPLLAVIACAPSEPPVPGEPWRLGPPLVGPRLEAGVTAIGSRVAVVGGFTINAAGEVVITRDVHILDTLTDTWTTDHPPLPVAWTHLGLAASAGSLYVLGGLEGQPYVARGEAFVLPIGTRAWQELAPMPPGLERGAAAVVSSPPHLFVLGGASTTGAVASCLEYNLTADPDEPWIRLPDLPIPRSHPAAMRTAEGTLIVAGGIGDQGQPLGDVWALPLNATAWEPRSPMPVGRARGGCAYGTIYDRLVCAGGERSTVVAMVDLYDPDEDRWDELPDMPAARAGAPGAVIGPQLYVPGGSSTFELVPTDTLQVFSLVNALGAP